MGLRRLKHSYRLLKRIFIAQLIFTLMFIEPAFSAFRTILDIDFYASTYVIEVYLDVEHIDDYGVVSIHATTNGVYAYGFLILKDPGEEEPHLYIIAGLQNETFDASLLKDRVFRARLALSIVEGLVMVSINDRVLRIRSKIPEIGLKKVYLSVFNATGREYDYPSIYIHSVKIYGCNQTLESLQYSLTRFNESIPCYSKVLLENVAVNTRGIRNRNVANYGFYIAIGLVIAATVATLMVYRALKKGVERSVKTSRYQLGGSLSHPH